MQLCQLSKKTSLPPTGPIPAAYRKAGCYFSSFKVIPEATSKEHKTGKTVIANMDFSSHGAQCQEVHQHARLLPQDELS